MRAPAADIPPRVSGSRFWAMELSGSLGDLGTFLPLVTAACLATGMDLGRVFVIAGLMNVVTGIAFRLPLPVQPMKAIAAAAISGSLSRDEVIAAGLLAGILMTAIGASGTARRIAGLIPRPVVRAIQLGVGVDLVLRGIGATLRLPLAATEGVLVALVCASLMALGACRRWPLALFVFLGGIAIAALGAGGVPSAQGMGGHEPLLYIPAAKAWLGGALRGALPQLPLTLLNSVVAVSLLSEDLFPGRGVAPERMATSVGLMNLVALPLGGLPMCHGSGGLAAQYHFGARTGGAVVALGLIKIAAGVLLGSALFEALHSYPVSILGPMLAFAGWELGRVARDQLHTPGLVPTLGGAAALVAWDTLVGFVVALVLHFVLRAISERSAAEASA